LPKRRGRNEDPIGKQAKAAKVAATKAVREAKEADKQKRTVEASAAKEKLAEMEVDESFVREQEHQGRIRRQSDMVAGAQRGGDESKSGSESTGPNEMESSHEEGTPSEDSDEPEALRKKSAAKVCFCQLIYWHESSPSCLSREIKRPSLSFEMKSQRRKTRSKARQGLVGIREDFFPDLIRLLIAHVQ
jgi:pyruvate/2-oxoglutarate dehydrogenase complex dihydrolipoamide acyltransferase (E2) component